MEYIVTLLGIIIAGLAAYIFEQNKKIQRLDNDVKIKEFEKGLEKSKRNLAAKKAAIEGAKHGAEKAINDLRVHLYDNYNITFDPSTGKIRTGEKSDKE